MNDKYQSTINKIKTHEKYTGNDEDPRKTPSLYKRIESNTLEINNLKKKIQELEDNP